MPLTQSQKRSMLAARRRGVPLKVLARRYGLAPSRVSEMLAGKCRYCGKRTGEPFTTAHPACRAAYKRLLADLSDGPGPEPDGVNEDGDPVFRRKPGAPPPPPTPVNWIDEVVEWSRTVRGGRQLGLPMVEADAANGTCVSKYGLCE